MIGGLSPMQVALVAVAFVSTVLGLVIGYQAYRGFLRHDSRAMRSLSAGLILLTALPYTLSFTGTLLIRLEMAAPGLRTPIGLAARVVQLAGLACIVYSLYSRP